MNDKVKVILEKALIYYKIAYDFIKKYKLIFSAAGLVVVTIIFFVYQNENPNSLDGMLKNADFAYSEGKIAVAIEDYNKIVRLYPNDYDTHIKLGRAYQQVNEPEKAKLEYYRAIKLGSLIRYDGYFGMADLYASQNQYDLAEDVLMAIKDVPLKEVGNNIGDFYLSWGNKLSEKDSFEATRKYKIALNYYKKADSKNIKNAGQALESAYSKMADKFIIDDNISEAIKFLKLSLQAYNNAKAHYRLAQIYENTNIDNSLSEFEKAYKINSKIAPSHEYIAMLVKKGNQLKNQGNEAAANFYFEKAKKLNTSIYIPFVADKNILVNLTSTRFVQDNNKMSIPGISFRVMNASKENINFMKVKVVFSSDNRNFSEVEKLICTPETPLQSDSSTPDISIFSDMSIPKVFRNPVIQMRIFISQREPDSWKLYRSTTLQRGADSFFDFS